MTVIPAWARRLGSVVPSKALRQVRRALSAVDHRRESGRSVSRIELPYALQEQIEATYQPSNEALMQMLGRELPEGYLSPTR